MRLGWISNVHDGGVIAWGENEYGETDVPPSATNVIAVSAGYGFSLALKSDRTVVSWGKNFYGETTIPEALANISAIAAGEDFSVALAEQGPPRIMREPRSVVGQVGDDVLFRTEISGTGPLTFQWNKDEQPIAGATNSFLFCGQLTPTSAGHYSVTVINPFGVTETASANLTIVAEPVTIPSIAIIEAGADDHAIVIVVGIRGGSGVQLTLETSDNLAEWTEVTPLIGAGDDAILRIAVSSHPEAPCQFWRVRTNPVATPNTP